MLILDLPEDILENVLKSLSYDEVSHCRLVCQRFNEISKRVLNHGFLKVKKFTLQCLESLKSQLPRRRSVRLKHPLAIHHRSLNMIDIYLSQLTDTFKEFMDLNICCFIPGKVLDEAFRVVRYISSLQTPIKIEENILQEIRDLSSMAMEHFDEEIATSLKKKQIYVESLENMLSYRKRLWQDAPTSQVYKKSRSVKKLSQKCRSVTAEISSSQIKRKELVKRIVDLEQSVNSSKKKLVKMEKTLSELQATISQQDARLQDQELEIEKLTKSMEDIQGDCKEEGVAGKSPRTGNRRGRKTAIQTKTTKRNLRQSVNEKLPKSMEDIQGDCKEEGVARKNPRTGNRKGRKTAIQTKTTKRKRRQSVNEKLTKSMEDIQGDCKEEGVATKKPRTGNMRGKTAIRTKTTKRKLRQSVNEKLTKSMQNIQGDCKKEGAASKKPRTGNMRGKTAIRTKTTKRKLRERVNEQ